MRLSPSSTRPLRCEPLETRDTPAGTVTASLSATGVLTLTGDEFDNAIQIQVTASGATVTGISGTKVNVVDSLDGTVRSINATMKDGDDLITIDGSTDFVLTGTAAFNLGDGDNDLSLVTSGLISLGGLKVTAGDGQDLVNVIGGVGALSQITGPATISVGIGRGDQDNPLSVVTDVGVRNISFPGPAGLKILAADGDEEFFLENLKVARALTVSGGNGGTTVVTTSSQFGSASITTVGHEPQNPPFGTSLQATDTTVTGLLALRSANGVNLDYTGGATGPIAIVAGPRGFTTTEFHGTTTVHGNITAAGRRHTIVADSGATPGVTGDISLNGPGGATVTVVDTGSLTARDIVLTTADQASVFTFGGTIDVRDVRERGTTAEVNVTSGTLTARDLLLSATDQAFLTTSESSVTARNANLAASNFAFYDQRDSDDTRVSAVAFTGNMSFRAVSVEWTQDEGTLTIGGNLTATATEDVTFNSTTAFAVSPPATTTVGGALNIQAGPGELLFDADGKALSVGTDLMLAALGNHRVSFDTTDPSDIGRNLTLTGGTVDNDFLLVRSDLTVGGNVNVSLGAGTNALDLGDDDGTLSVTGGLTILTGTGSDNVVLANVAVAGPTKITTGSGADRLTILGPSTFVGTVTADTGSGDDVLNLANVAGKSGPLTFNAAASFKLGAGNDVLNLGLAQPPDATGDVNSKVIFAAPAGNLIDGGTGLNLYDDELDQFTGTVAITGFTDPTP